MNSRHCASSQITRVRALFWLLKHTLPRLGYDLATWIGRAHRRSLVRVADRRL